MKKTILAIGLLLTTNTLFAGYTTVGKMVNITAYKSTAIILLDKKISTSCKYKDRIIVEDYTNTYKAVYSTILAAKVSDSLIRIGYSQCDKSGFTKAYSAQIQ